MRYDRLDPLGQDTEGLRDATVAVIGAGATGSRMLEQLARLGADLHIIDRDYLEEQNLATSALYTEDDVERTMPKAVAAAERLAEINGGIEIDADVADLNARTASDLLGTPDVVLDGTDNVEARRLINEYCVETSLPWVHVAALREAGAAMPIVPGKTACFNCVFGAVDAAQLPTCETAGISPAAAAVAASRGVTAAVRLLNGNGDGGLQRFDLEADRFERLEVARQEDCTVCARGEFPHLDGEAGTTAARVCGENTYHVAPGDGDVDLASLEEELSDVGTVARNEHLLRFEGAETFTLFRDGRMIVAADSAEKARSIYARYVGS